MRLNLEQGHAILAGHSFEHEIALAQALGVFGSIDMNRNDQQSGWDTDQFPNDVAEVALAYYHILKGGGFGAGGTNFDAKLRRQSIDPVDLLAAHAGRDGRVRAGAEGGVADAEGTGPWRPRSPSATRVGTGSSGAGFSTGTSRSTRWRNSWRRITSTRNRVRAARNDSRTLSTVTSDRPAGAPAGVLARARPPRARRAASPRPARLPRGTRRPPRSAPRAGRAPSSPSARHRSAPSAPRRCPASPTASSRSRA